MAPSKAMTWSQSRVTFGIGGIIQMLQQHAFRSCGISRDGEGSSHNRRDQYAGNGPHSRSARKPDRGTDYRRAPARAG